MLTTLAQIGTTFSNNPQGPPPGALIALIFTGFIVALLIKLVIMVGVCILLHIIQARVQVEHRVMAPGLVWLILIPFFDLVWNFIVFQQIPESYKRYFDSMGDHSQGDCGKGIGLWYAICSVCTLIPCVSIVTGPAAIVLLIIFLIKLFGLRGRIPVAQ